MWIVVSIIMLSIMTYCGHEIDVKLIDEKISNTSYTKLAYIFGIIILCSIILGMSFEKGYSTL